MTSMKDEALKGAKPLREHISPEGVEEQIELEIRFMITKTMGGKFRSYGIGDDGTQQTFGVDDTIEKARERLTVNMLTTTLLLTTTVYRKPKK